jgi:hypothetical protein
MLGSFAAGAGRQCAPAALILPLSIPLMSSLRSTRSLRLCAAPQLHR